MAMMKLATLVLGLIWLCGIPEIKAQTPTRADIVSLQNQIDFLLTRLIGDESDILNNYNLIISLRTLEAQHWNSTQANFNAVFADLNYLNNAVVTLNNNVVALAAAIDIIQAEAELLAAAVDRLLINNEIWLHNFRVIKNIFQNGLKFRGNINYGTAVSVGGALGPRKRTKPNVKNVGPNNAAAGVGRNQGQGTSAAVATRRPGVVGAGAGGATAGGGRRPGGGTGAGAANGNRIPVGK